MSSSPSPQTNTTSSASSLRSKKLVCPKVWKRPHSTIYGKNVEFGSSLYSDKIGEINGRKFNSELPWTMRNSGTSSSGSTSGQYNQGYLSNLLLVDPKALTSSALSSPSAWSSSALPTNYNYADLLELTNPSRNSKRSKQNWPTNSNNSMRPASIAAANDKRIDFYDQYMEFSNEISHLHNSSLLMNEPILRRKMFDHFLDFDYELGLFVPNRDCYDSKSGRSLTRKSTLMNNELLIGDINTKSFVPLPTKTQTTKLLPKHDCQLMSSPYGQSADGRKLSLGSINPQSYRPSLPHKTTTAHASDGEEFEFHDRSSPFYTDRWAGKTIRHFDSDLYSNANLFKSMIL